MFYRVKKLNKMTFFTIKNGENIHGKSKLEEIRNEIIVQQPYEGNKLQDNC